MRIEKFVITFISFIIFSLIVNFLASNANTNVAPKLIKDSMIFIYPSEARDKRLEGTVVLKILIGEDGAVKEKEIHRSSGYDVLDQTALKVAETARFKPARIDGIKKSVRITWPLVFEITSLTFHPDGWVEKTEHYQHDASSNEDSKSRLAQQDLIYHYRDFSKYMVEQRKPFLNETVLRVVLPDIRKKWLDFYDAWPLTFILFQDFTARYPESEFMIDAESYLTEYIKNEMFQIKVRSNVGTIFSRGRDLYQELLSFLQQNYPDSITDDLLKNIPKK